MNQDQNDNKQNYDTMDENNHGYASVNENNIETADPIVEIASEQEQPPMPVYRTPAQLAQQTYQMDQMDQMDKEKQETNSYVYTGQPMETIKPETDRRRQDKRKSKKERGNGSKFFLVITLGIFFGIFAALAFQATSHFTKVIFGEEIETKIEATPELPIIEQQAPIVDDGFVSQPKNFVSTDVTAVVEKAMPSVVAITNLSVQQVEDFFGGVQSQEIASSGSGIIIGENGEELLIITNHHVIESSNTLTVYFVDDEYVEGVVKGSDSNLDLAVIAIPLDQIKDSTREAIRIATLGDSNSLRVGEPAIAIGNALGYGQSVTVGVISAVDRDLQDSELESALIQTDAAINPGNSGGALLNVNGEVIGINTKKVGGTVIEGMGYAIPVSDVSETITKLMTQKTKLTVPEAERGLLGIRGMDVTPEFADMYNMPIGVYVTELIEGGGAEQAGMPINSVITGLNDRTITNMNDLVGEIAFYRAGDTVTVTFQRQGDSGEFAESTLDITLTKSDS